MENTQSRNISDIHRQYISYVNSSKISLNFTSLQALNLNPAILYKVDNMNNSPNILLEQDT